MLKICEYYKDCRVRRNCAFGFPKDYIQMSTVTCGREVNDNTRYKHLLPITEFQWKIWVKSDDYNKPV
jgi:hypothetical protein